MPTGNISPGVIMHATSALIFCLLIGGSLARTLTECEVCRMFAGAVISLEATGSYEETIGKCKITIWNVFRQEDEDNQCRDFYSAHDTTISLSYKALRDAGAQITPASLCTAAEFCHQQQTIFQMLNTKPTLAEKSETTSVRAQQCDTCKKVSVTVTNTLPELESLEDTELGGSTAHAVCRLHWPGIGKPYWHTFWSCNAMVYDLLHSHNRISGATDQTVCEALGYCDISCESNSYASNYYGGWSK